MRGKMVTTDGSIDYKVIDKPISEDIDTDHAVIYINPECVYYSVNLSDAEEIPGTFVKSSLEINILDNTEDDTTITIRFEIKKTTIYIENEEEKTRITSTKLYKKIEKVSPGKILVSIVNGTINYRYKYVRQYVFYTINLIVEVNSVI